MPKYELCLILRCLERVSAYDGCYIAFLVLSLKGHGLGFDCVLIIISIQLRSEVTIIAGASSVSKS